MYVCMCVYIYMCVCVYVYVYVRKCVCMCGGGGFTYNGDDLSQTVCDRVQGKSSSWLVGQWWSGR